MSKLDDSFLTYACNILAETNKGLSGTKIVEYCNSYAIDFNKKIPFDSYPFSEPVPNKRTALLKNLRAFDDAEQFRIILDLCNLSALSDVEGIKELKINLYKRYGNFATTKISETELIQKTKHWLAKYSNSLKQYESALSKYESGIFERNTLDDIRLSFELLIKNLLKNEKSLENQIPELGSKLKASGCSAELQNMFQKIIKYYTDYQNHYVKHNDLVNSDEIEYIIELTSVFMKFLIKKLEENNHG